MTMPGAPMIPAPHATNQHDNKTDLKTNRLEIAIIWIDVIATNTGGVSTAWVSKDQADDY